ncbi:hypothetical protein MM236_19345 [Belliella sp. DSM 107340]|uniref:Uncharacterized protein n=1 Tax=Belliella calami TaxID=2923436 RepID=A0ABS9UU55_9BACT|nr:hypothetical protein [Belliella calami]MCH7400158.1 hypothetical protein [Belliella calami]
MNSFYKLISIIGLILGVFIPKHDSFGQNCSINAGGNQVICGTTATLLATRGGNLATGNPSPIWTLEEKPLGATDPLISSPNTLNTDVSGLNSPGIYRFRVSQSCESGTTSSIVSVTAPGEVSTFTAGPDITGVSALVGEATLSGVIPPGYTGQWTYYNIFEFEFFSNIVTTNAVMVNDNTETPNLNLLNKVNHPADPAYIAILTITSINNPNCTYSDRATVRFVPNPEIVVPTSVNFCQTPPNNRIFFNLQSTSPIFSTLNGAPNASGHPDFGTTVTLTPISQPIGGNIGFLEMRSGVIFLSGVSVIGSYTFNLTVSNSIGSFTTPSITFNFNGSEPQRGTFVNSNYPDQMQLYSFVGTGGAVYCNKEGDTNPITFFFGINPDDPEDLITNVSVSNIFPPGQNHSIESVSGQGTRERLITVAPPSGGWNIGTYKIFIELTNGTCRRSHIYYIHISDAGRSDIEVDDTTVCYPGSGSVSATIMLPEVFISAVNSSYFQDFSGHYQLTSISRPPGAANPIFQANNLRSLTNVSTVISNLNREGEYVFRIRAVPYTGSVGDFLEKEFECSGASLESTFSVFVSTQRGANAGSDFGVSCVPNPRLLGNDPGPASSGEWIFVTGPDGASPVFSDQNLPNTEVTGLTEEGDYTFRWSITTGDCVSNDEMTISVGLCNRSRVITNPMLPSKIRIL